MTGLRPKKDGLVVSHIMHTLLNRLVLLAVIAGTASIDPLSSLIILGADDGKVAVGNTKVTGMQDHLTVAASHTFFPQNQEVQAQTLFFLKARRICSAEDSPVTERPTARAAYDGLLQTLL
jgi:hypothetical protein